ncbi:MAG: hypothetical protein ACYCSB_02155 [bacterium]
MKKIIVMLIFALSFTAAPVIAHAGEPGVINSSALNRLLTKNAGINSGNGNGNIIKTNIKELGAEAFLLGYNSVATHIFTPLLYNGYRVDITNMVPFCKSQIKNFAMTSNYSYLTEKCMKGILFASKIYKIYK